MKLKALNLLIFFSLFLTYSCTNEYIHFDDTPEDYTQKAILEYFCGTWCGFCPDGDYMAEQAASMLPQDKFNFIVFHTGDQMDFPDDNDIDQKFQNGYPTGMINRANGEATNRYIGIWNPYSNYDPEKNNAWYINAGLVIEKEAKCGLAIDASKLNGQVLTVDVKLGIAQEDLSKTPHYISVFVFDNEMMGEGRGWDQYNFFSKFGSAVWGSTHPYYEATNPILNFKHPHVVRAVLHNNALGDKLEDAVLKPNSVNTFSYTIDLSQGIWDDDLTVIAFVHEYVYDPVESRSFIQNVQWVNVGDNQPFD